MIMRNEGMNLPPGFRFDPRDDELINFYLKPRVMEETLPCRIINDDVQVYSPDSTPWVLFDVNDPDSWIRSKTTEKTLYAFTSLSRLATVPNKKITRKRSNTIKKAGCGAWVQKSKRDPIIDGDGNVIGGKRMLNFEVQAAGYGHDDKAVYFKMHEYSLWGINDTLGSDIVLCQITCDPCKEPFYKLPTKTTTDDQVSKTGRKPQNKIPKNQVSRKGRKPHKKIHKDENLQGSSTLTSESEPVMSGNGYQESTSLHPQSLVPLDGDVGNAEFGGNQCFDGQGGEGLCFDGQGGEGLCFDGQGGEGLCSDDLDNEDLLQSFDISGFLEYLKSNPLGESLEDATSCGLGKRKSVEEDNSCQAKRMCFQ